MIDVLKLRAGGSCYRVEGAEEGFLIYVIEGREAEFNELARSLINQSGPVFIAFARPDGHGGYDCVHILPLEPT
jgi:hypothetical protein